ncbi:MAG: tRNA lysidine(34) synthetase TilS [Candidatus Cloacimonadia bacterium]
MSQESQFITTLSDFIATNNLIDSGDVVIVGFSGGADSTALIHTLWRLRTEFDFKIVAAHINYNLRGEESIQDREFVAKFCSQHSIVLFIKDTQIDDKADLENVARNIRFEFFYSLAANYKNSKIALGHNKEDSVETMLQHFLRGSGITGLRGILPKNNNVIRPLLNFKREEIVDYLNENDIHNWREDSTNKESLFNRNRLRNNLIPWIENEFNPNIVHLLYENAIIYQETEEYLKTAARNLLRRATLQSEEKFIQLDLSKINVQNRILLYYLFREVVANLSDTESDFYHSHFKEITSLLSTSGTKMTKLSNNILAVKEYSTLTFTIETKEEYAANNLESREESIELTRKFQLFNNKRIVFDRINISRIKKSQYKFREIALLDLDKIKFPVTVSFRKPGDRFIPLGMTGLKKLKDFFIDEKVNKFDRDKIFIFRDAEKIIWIGEHRIDERVKIDESTQNVLRLKIENVRIRKTRSAQRNIL